MKKSKRILALITAVLLIALYVSTLIFALIDHPICNDLLKISVAGTIVLPVLIYAYSLICRLINRDDDPDHDD